MSQSRLIWLLLGLFALGLLGVAAAGAADGIYHTALGRELPYPKYWDAGGQVAGIVAGTSFGALLAGLVVSGWRYLAARARSELHGSYRQDTEPTRRW